MKDELIKLLKEDEDVRAEVRRAFTSADEDGLDDHAKSLERLVSQGFRVKVPTVAGAA